MIATSSHPIRKALGAAAVSVTALLASANLGHAQQLSAADTPAADTLTANAKLPALTTPDYGRDHVFTLDECRLIRTATLVMFGRVGPNNLSTEFRQSMIGFVMPDGQRSTCAGPRQIAWRTQEDAATFNSIAGLLLTPSTNVSLRRAGVDLAAAPVASLSLR